MGSDTAVGSLPHPGRARLLRVRRLHRGTDALACYRRDRGDRVPRRHARADRVGGSNAAHRPAGHCACAGDAKTGGTIGRQRTFDFSRGREHHCV